MADSLTTLRQSLANVDAQIAALTSTINPDYSLDGEAPGLSSHLERLVNMRKTLREAIIAEEGPTELHVQGTT